MEVGQAFVEVGRGSWRLWRSNLDHPSPTSTNLDSLVSSRRPFHGAATEHVQMKMKYRLAAVRIGVHHDAIAFGGNPNLLRHVAREREEPPECRGVLRI